MNKPSIKFAQKYNNISKTNVCYGGQPLLNKGFTLIELLAVIVILAIIALIAIPQILNIINDSKKKSVEISVQNYLKAVDLSIMNKELNEDKVLHGIYNIFDNGKTLVHIDNNSKKIKVEYDGQGLTGGVIKIENNKVVNLDTKIYKWYVIVNNETIDIKDKQNISTLLQGSEFNKVLKSLTNGEGVTNSTKDSTITSIEFYSNGILPSGHTLSSLDELDKKVDVKASGAEPITAYYENGKVYIVSKNLISFNTSATNVFYNFTSLNNIQFGNIDTSNVTTMRTMFLNCSNLTNLNLKMFNTSKVEDMYQMFTGCESLTSLDLNNFDVSNVRILEGVFSNCKDLLKLKISDWNIASAENIGGMFNGCENLRQLNVNSWDTTNVKKMALLFKGCKSLKQLNLSNWNTSKVEYMYQMFNGCKSLTNIIFGENFNTSNVTNMLQMFSGCEALTTLDLSKFNTQNVKSMEELFFNCKSLNTLDLSNFNTSQVTNMKRMFGNANLLENLQFGENFKTDAVTTMTHMFIGCSSLTSLDLSNWNTQVVTDMEKMFNSTTNLQTINIGCGWKTSENNANMFQSSKYTQEQFDALVLSKQQECSLNTNS